MKKIIFIKLSLIGLLICCGQASKAQKAYFIDGYHGGVWGHYPIDYTGFIVEQLKKYPDWKINLEIEPETWDRAKIHEAEAYQELQEIVSNQTSSAKVEFVNPTYAQSYLFNTSGESIIRQFHYGIKKIKQHFPTAAFNTYSSEEPCFTSSLPQILNLFGFKYASLKNPNTCWGGYTRNFEGELINWIGPDGTSILTVPRYEFESLKKGSTWETIANANSVAFITSAFKHGLKKPIGMCLQDAEWKFGPWLSGDYYKPTVYTTWTNYFDTVVDKKLAVNTNVNQEDIQVSLVWGSQVLQKIAKEVKSSENKIIQAENLAAISYLLSGDIWPQEKIDKAWRTLMLSQHHDCWIVPYNGEKKNTWADKVDRWTDTTDLYSDDVLKTSILKLNTYQNRIGDSYLRLFNTTSNTRREWVSIDLPIEWNSKEISLINKDGKQIPVERSSFNEKSILIFAEIPPLGYVSYKMVKKDNIKIVGAKVLENKDGTIVMETDLYHLVLDPNKGGVITKLLLKKEGVDYVDRTSGYYFNELRGFFYDQNKFRSSRETKAKISILENNSAKISVKVEGLINDSPFQQVISLHQGQKRIDFSVNIDWLGQPKIGEFEEVNYNNTNLHKAFYNDKYKLQVLFPVILKDQVLYKDAPFDVTKSKLKNTFFSTWDSIKNNIILNWVDIHHKKSDQGLALFTDHVTSYTHGDDHPLGLTIQYAGKGLWGRDYKIISNTLINYAIIPHTGNWESAKISSENTNWNQPIITSFLKSKLNKNEYEKSLINLNNENISVSALNVLDNQLIVRLFNSSSADYSGKINLDLLVKNAYSTNFLNEKIDRLEVEKFKDGSALNLDIKKFGLVNILLELK